MFKKIVTGLLMLLVLTACQPLAFEPEPYEPVSSFVTNQIDPSEPEEDTRPLYVSNAEPRKF